MSTFGTVINGMRKAGFDIMVNTNQKVLATKKIVVMTMGIIPELGGISGPILTPQDFPIGIVQALVNSRRKVYECNPKNPSERILLTISNVNANNFAPKEIENPSMIVERRNNIKKIGYEKKKEPVVSPVHNPIEIDPDDVDVDLLGDFTKVN